ncbi:hypothetical protein TrVE_jg9431 [Triparma verrucosa]|uniref:Sulfate transporter n=1 Tax=Triparma verrucosa TaxID=1606542 RepID=A0A9W7BW01_9STRA|nr:hypothetical protein TrVE_jg9431 [Triparma verrucosa]
MFSRLRLSRYCAYVPIPVVGGYLGFIGYFCMQAGVAMCVGVGMSTVESWKVLGEGSNLLLALPGITSALLLLYTSRLHSHYLPHVMCLIPLLFYLMIYGIYGDECISKGRDIGLIGTKHSSPPSSTEIIQYLNPHNVDWSILPSLLPTCAGMIVVVSFSSTLDVTAISIDIGSPLDTDKELETVGISNILSGLTGGFTGSYIFSQTIFQYRTKEWSRWVGIVVAASESVVFMMDEDVLSYSPLFFFGATLIFIGLDLLIEWLHEIREKLLPQEYLILLATFVSIQIVGIDAGVGVGLIFSIIDHAATTSNQDSKHHVRKIERRSRKVRSLESWKSVQAIAYNGQVATFELRGVLYFGNSIQLLRMLFESIGIDSQKAFDFKELMKSPGRATPQDPRDHGIKRRGSLKRRGSGPSRKIFPRFIVLDYHNVQTVDASAAKTFRQFVDTANKHDVIVCGAGFTPRVEKFLRVSNVLAPHAPASALPPLLSESSRKLLSFKSVSKALEFCEEQLINSNSSSLTSLSPAAAHIRNASLNSVSPAKADEPYPLLTLINVLLGNRSARSSPSQTSADDPAAPIFNKYHDLIRLQNGEYLFQQSTPPSDDDDDVDDRVSVESYSSDDSDTFFFLLEGHVTAYITGEKPTHLERGSVIGYVDFLLQRPRSFNAVVEGRAMLAKLTRAQMSELSEEHPALYVKVERCVLRSSVLELANHDEC